MTAFFNGATYPFRALRTLAAHPRLWSYVVVPIIVNIAIALTLYIGLLTAGFRLIDGAIANTTLGVALTILLEIVLGIALLLLAGFLLVRFGVVLGSPWYGKLSEQLELLRTGQAPPAEPLTPGGIARDLWRALSFEAKKLLLFLPIGGVLLLLNLIPVAGQFINIVGWILLGELIACLDFFDGPQERRRISFRQKLGAVQRSLPASLGFGLVSLALVSIPFVNLLAIPICVAAGTLFVCDYLLVETPQLAAR